jgi:cation transport regulator ChaC
MFELFWNQHSVGQDDITWGVAYRIPEAKIAETKAYLDHREKNGYETHFLDVYQPGSNIPVVEKVS